MRNEIRETLQTLMVGISDSGDTMSGADDYEMAEEYDEAEEMYEFE